MRVSKLMNGGYVGSRVSMQGSIGTLLDVQTDTEGAIMLLIEGEGGVRSFSYCSPDTKIKILESTHA